ncbi:MAG: hypothetical protein NTV34_13420, partial [Proteobacteria bacterium]|nr:hypothetical protein [Pseudomonadota bacterium]
MISRRLVSAKCVNCLLSLLALGSLIGFVYASALAGGRVGTGGDWRRIMLAQAQREAANWANSAALNLEVIAEDAQIDRNGVVFKFVTYPDSLKKLGADIIASTHLYEEEAQIPGSEYTTCAWTNDPDSQSLNDIVFSLKLCEGGLFNGGQSFANRLLLHESVHHLLRDQSFRTAIGADFPGSRAEQDRAEDNLCDDVASAIHRAFETVTIEGGTHWRD